MKFLVLFLLSCTLLACAPKQDDSRTAKKGGDPNDSQDSEKPEEKKRKNITNYELCGSGPSGLTTPEGRWEIFESSEDFYFKTALEFNAGTLTLRQDCYHKTHRLTAQVTVAASYDRGILKVLAGATDSDKVEYKEGSFDCRVTLKEGSGNYAFAGHCLELKAFQGTEFLKFAPQ